MTTCLARSLPRSGLKNGERKISGMSGTSPQRFICDAAEKILQGERRAVLVTGGEALATRKASKEIGPATRLAQSTQQARVPF